jgi:cysteine desulfurase
VLRHGAKVRPRIAGGGQERGRRSGTPNVAGAVATAAALTATDAGRHDDVARVAALRDRLSCGLISQIAGTTESGRGTDRVAGILHLRIDGVESEALVVLLDEVGIAASAGAACSSGAVEPSHVLTSMGLDAATASSGVRFSLGVTTTDQDVDHALDRVPHVVERLRN